MSAYYNENDPFAAAWLRRLILFGHIADGFVDERPIQDVRSIDLDGFRQCHFFAGIGVWSHALRRAGWEDDRPAWTGSCSCQPFSLAGAGGGFGDPRHLWPCWFDLIGQRRPVAVFGEQVASAGAWLDLVHGDMEGIGYAVGAVDLPAAGFGGAHIRQRFFWVADTDKRRHEPADETVCTGRQSSKLHCELGGLADACGVKRQPWWNAGKGAGAQGEPARLRSAGGLVDAAGEQAGLPRRAWEPRGAVEWVPCADGKWRPVEPGAFPLAHAAPARVGRLRGYGNALDAEAATQFIEAYMEI